NFGLDRAQGDVIGRIDADSVLEPNWVEEVQKAFTDPTVAACTGPVIYYDMPLRRFGAKADDTLRRAIITLARQYHLLFGSNTAGARPPRRATPAAACPDPEDELPEAVALSPPPHDHRLRVTYSPQMVAGMSARRIEDSPREYYHYVTRFERTYQRHRVRN